MPAVNHADHQRHPLVSVVRGGECQDQELHLGSLWVGRPQFLYSAQQLRAGGRHVHLLPRPPGEDAVGIVASLLLQFPANRLKASVSGSGRHRILAAVVDRKRVFGHRARPHCRRPRTEGRYRWVHGTGRYDAVVQNMTIRRKLGGVELPKSQPGLQSIDMFPTNATDLGESGTHGRCRP